MTAVAVAQLVDKESSMNLWQKFLESSMLEVKIIRGIKDSFLGASDKTWRWFLLQTADSQETTRDVTSISTGLLTRLLSATGEIALRQLVHLDVSVFGELRRRQTLKDEQGNRRRSLGPPAATPRNSKKKVT